MAARELSVECWVRLVRGSHPCLTLDWRRGRALVSDGHLELSLEAADASARYEPPFDVVVALVDPDGVDQQPQGPGAPHRPSQRTLLVTTTAGDQRERRPGDLGVRVARDGMMLRR